MALFHPDQTLCGPQRYDRFGPWEVTLGPTKSTPYIAKSLGAQDKLGGNWTLHRRNDSNIAIGLISGRSARITQAAQKLVVGYGDGADKTSLQDRLSRLYRRHVSFLGPGYTLLRGDDALLGLAVYLRESNIDAQLRPALSAALCAKSAAFAAALAYVNSPTGPARAKTIFVETALAIVFGRAPQLRSSDHWEHQRDFHSEVVRLTHSKSDLAPPASLPKSYAEYCEAPIFGQPSLVASTRARFQAAIDLAWERQITAERIAMRMARALPAFTLRRLRDGKSIFTSDLSVYRRLESKFVDRELTASICLAARLFWERERGVGDSVARSWDDEWQSLFTDVVQTRALVTSQTNAELVIASSNI